MATENINISIENDKLAAIDRAASKELRSRSNYLTHYGLKRAKELGVYSDDDQPK